MTTKEEEKDPRTPEEKERDETIRRRFEGGYTSFQGEELQKARARARHKKEQLRALRAGRLPQVDLTLEVVLQSGVGPAPREGQHSRSGMDRLYRFRSLGDTLVSMGA